MSLNISNAKYVKVFDPQIKLAYSDKVVFATLVSSRKTGNVKINKETGEIVVNPETGKEVMERVNSRWEGRFVGNAAERVKVLAEGASINIIEGWVCSETTVSKNGKKYINTYVTISEFEPSEIAEGFDEGDEE